MASSEDNIKLVISVDTETSLTKMQGQITQILSEINKAPYEISVRFNETDLNNMKSQIGEITKSISGLNSTGLNMGGGVIGSGSKSTSAIADAISAVTAAAGEGEITLQQYYSLLNRANNAYLQGQAAVEKYAAAHDSVNKSVSGTYNSMVAQLSTLQDTTEAFANDATVENATELATQIQKMNYTVSDGKVVFSEFNDSVSLNQNLLGSAATALGSLDSKLKEYSAAQYSSNQASRDAYSAMQNQRSALVSTTQAYKNNQASAKELQQTVSESNRIGKESTTTFKENGDAAQSLATKISNVTKVFASFFSAQRIIMQVIQAMKQLVSTAIELDDAMTQLKIVTNETDSTYESFANNISKTAQELSASVTDLVDATTTYARLGYSLDESSTLAEYTAMLQNVGDIDASDAQDAITSIVKAFDVNIDDIETIMDELVAVGK